MVDDAVCEAVAGSRDLEILNLTMVKRLTAAGMRAILDGCTWFLWDLWIFAISTEYFSG